MGFLGIQTILLGGIMQNDRVYELPNGTLLYTFGSFCKELPKHRPEASLVIGRVGIMISRESAAQLLRGLRGDVSMRRPFWYTSTPSWAALATGEKITW